MKVFPRTLVQFEVRGSTLGLREPLFLRIEIKDTFLQIQLAQHVGDENIDEGVNVKYMAVTAHMFLYKT